MKEFVSEIKTIPFSEELVYKALSDLRNLERVQDKIPQDKVSDFEFDQDSCSFAVKPVGKVKFSIIEREPFKTIKFTANEAPIEILLWIQIKKIEDNICKLKLTVKAKLNPFIKPMVSKPLKEGIEKVAEVLANLPYNEIMIDKE
ncbi:hypothetical protein AwDysgo_04230 [Bacteroidales bacterium]|nr:hypothetical protein AwDysgo_04230 [Bacteroidales bacterium]